ncbi:phosphatidylglycerophosphate synthase [Candidatus Methanoperedens nitroreducens]|uniref:Archaetidylinositol phosphate synthase n=1 Tax=Candidatus Methanoperedens nitratireducens TaxID=1392998 RepID=A0A062V6V2_9EURY|nr:CDP-alcohol phosphatidyltransferase family protein [Candidatus Methanoperedens nitroreducens]KCZ73027.1 phosphatidylglycerophosphate synthase [Candidatus Methanoperedens nitroreducens]MDJ1423029.1 CDP-alcohol phosphatidyltransferase family protein [Candidatus Methanoperedens sp.]
MLERKRQFIRDALRPLAKMFIAVNPNTLTIFGLLISLISAVFFARREVFIAGILLLLSGFFDILDGAVARENNRITRFGGFLDSVCDRFADTAVILGAMYGGLTTISPFPGWSVGAMAIVGSLMVSYTRARAEAAGASAAVGIGERAVRMAIIIIGAFLNMVNWAILLVAVISFITVFQRIAFVRKVLK